MIRILLAVCVAVCISCDSERVFEDNADFSEAIWIDDSLATFSFTIKEVDEEYDLFLNLRNTNTYPYHNLYVKYYLTDSSQNELASELINKNLFDPKTGKPLGAGLGDLFSHQFLILDHYKFDYAGEYHFAIQQYMRQDSLQGIVSAGVRVAKSTSP